MGSIQRLSVAVIIDNKIVASEDGSPGKAAYSDEEIQRFENLIKETIGFDTNRGDSVSVVNAPFLEIEKLVVAEVPVWQSLLNETWIVTLVKQVLGALGLLLLYFLFGRPLLRSLTFKDTSSADDKSAATTATSYPPPMPMQQGYAGAPMGGQYPGIPNLSDDPNNAANMVRRKDATYEQKVGMARSMVMEDPARVANVMRQWVGE